VTAPIQVAGTLAISKSADRAQVPVGEGVVYSVVVTSSGPSAALGVTVQETLPAGGTVTDATATQGGYDAASGIWTVGTVAADVPAVLTLTVSYDRPGDTVNTVTVASVDTAGTATAAAPVTVVAAAVTPEPPAPEPPAPPAGQGSTGTLPYTGLPADDLGLSGLGLLLIGLALTLIAKRRRTA